MSFLNFTDYNGSKYFLKLNSITYVEVDKNVEYYFNSTFNYFKRTINEKMIAQCRVYHIKQQNISNSLQFFLICDQIQIDEINKFFMALSKKYDCS